MICLLCESPAVADCLCVPCGAKLWAALTVAQRKAEKTPSGTQYGDWYRERSAAMEALWEGCEDEPDYNKASAFLSRLEAARAARAALTPTCPECGRMVKG
jgi:hypothetical protein